MASQIEIAQVVAMIGSAYPSFSPTKETVGLYYQLLQDLEVELVRAATLQCCAEAGRKFAPSIGEIRGAAGEITRKAQGVPSAVEAWDEVCHAPKSEKLVKVTGEREENGAVIIEERPYQWSHPLVERVVKLLGFPDFPDWGKESFERAHFLKYYELELQRYTSEGVELPEVTGYIESRRRNKALPMGEILKRLEKK